MLLYMFFFFNDTATTEIYTLSLHDALPICNRYHCRVATTEAMCKPAMTTVSATVVSARCHQRGGPDAKRLRRANARSEEHTSELQSRQYLVCRLLLEKKKKIKSDIHRWRST